MCKLIWPLWSTHIFTQWGWLILFSPDHFPGHHENSENLPNTLFLSNWTDLLTVRSLHSSSVTTPWGKPSNLWTSWVCSLRPRVPSWIWIRCIQSATHRNTFMSPLTLAMSTMTCNSAQTSSYLIPVQHYLETFMPLSNNNQDHTFMGEYILPVLNQETRLLLHLWRPYLTQTFNNALTVTMQKSFRHLAAKIPSQLHNYFFLPFYETSSIEVHFIFAVIKLLDWKPSISTPSLFYFLSSNIEQNETTSTAIYA